MAQHDLARLQQFGGQLGVPGLEQLAADQLCRRFQREHIGRARLILRQDDIPQCFPLKLQAHQAAQIVLVGRQRCPGQCAALQPHTADGAFRIAELRLQAENLPLGFGPAAVKAEALLHPGTAQCRPGKVLFAVAEKIRIPRDLPGKGGAGQILDVPHQIAFFIGARRDEPTRCLGLRINRTRHCSPARPAGHP